MPVAAREIRAMSLAALPSTILFHRMQLPRNSEIFFSSSRRTPLSDLHIFIAISAIINALNSFSLPSSRRTPGPRLSTRTHAESLGPDLRRDDENLEQAGTNGAWPLPHQDKTETNGRFRNVSSKLCARKFSCSFRKLRSRMPNSST
jgi:hypothetical protein